MTHHSFVPEEGTTESTGGATDAAIVIDHVSREFRSRRSSLFGPAPVVHALSDVSLVVPRRSRFGIVGESGSGKTTLVRLIAALDRPSSGRVVIDGTDISTLTDRQLRPTRKRLQLVFQDPMGSLNPRMRIGEIVGEPLQVQGASGIADRVAAVLEQVGMPASVMNRYPHQFSGGQRQRISIARAIAPRPAILLADEAVSALDVTIRAQILQLLDELATVEDFTMVFVSHDLSVIQRVCDRVAVLHRGKLVETGTIDEVYGSPQEEYTRELLGAVPTLERGLASALERQACKAAREPWASNHSDGA
ncbi:ABC transporter ATP-binding protein [Nakamurella antarctica]|uniref:ABC transporter ATP-binding protein n=1 Tax=Nakamurella antarctica TaxID=1902245 RepID=A0A3G8ZLE2_9ACTN|nr:ABC transporter ATP-binding protein [Nakamurella antarctica]AZI58030.1 ABC transporter ATP-binding protein [Nakamurella antarctica]